MLCGLKTALQFRWTCLGYDFGEDYAALLAKTLHAQGLSVIDDIDHIDWEHIPIDQFGLGLADMQVLDMIKKGSNEVAQQLIVDARVRLSLPKPVEIKRVVNGHVPFDFNEWMSRQPKYAKANIEQTFEGSVIWYNKKTFMEPLPEAARIAFGKKLQKRFALMQSKSPDNLHRKPGSVEINQISMVARDREKIEHVLDTCWNFFVTWCKSSERYKTLFRNGEPNKAEIELQRDCFRNGSVAHKTISQWRRNAEFL